MNENKDPYFYIFNKLSDLIDEIREIQVEAEELFISSESKEQEYDNN